MLPCHIVTDSLTSLSLGHMTRFDCVFLTDLAMYLVSFPQGELGQNPSILSFPTASGKKRKTRDEPERVRQRKMKEFGGGNYSLLE